MSTTAKSLQEFYCIKHKLTLFLMASLQSRFFQQLRTSFRLCHAILKMLDFQRVIGQMSGRLGGLSEVAQPQAAIQDLLQQPVAPNTSIQRRVVAWKKAED